MTTLGYIVMMLIAVLILIGLLIKGVETDTNNCDKKVHNKDMLDRMIEEDLEAFNDEMRANKDKHPKVNVDVDPVIGNASYPQIEVPQFVEVKGDDSVTFPIPEELKVKLDLLDLPKASNAHTVSEVHKRLEELTQSGEYPFDAKCDILIQSSDVPMDKETQAAFDEAISKITPI